MTTYRIIGGGFQHDERGLGRAARRVATCVLDGQRPRAVAMVDLRAERDLTEHETRELADAAARVIHDYEGRG